nr:thioredoxin fold domain-containing protein [Puniceibacterium sp. IMCC21224]
MLWAMTAVATPALADPRLVMVEQPGCVYCARWDAEIAPIYPKTAEGRFAPLLRADLRADPPDGIIYDRPVSFTPTFVLIDDGHELARIEGYPGDNFFWSLLEQMLRDHTGFEPAPS